MIEEMATVRISEAELQPASTCPSREPMNRTQTSIAFMLGAFVFSIFSSPAALATAPVRPVNSTEAEELVRAAIGLKRIASLPKFNVLSYRVDYFPQFYFFEAIWDNPIPGSAILGHFAVNSHTAEVWDVTGCKVMHSRGLTRLQRDFQKKLALAPGMRVTPPQQAPCAL